MKFVIMEGAMKNAQKVAVIEEEKKCSYIELIESSKKIGSGISKIIEPREPFTILMEKGINTLKTFFGTVYAGCFYILLNPELPTTRLQKILEVSETKIIITV